jgi:GNAT superfamily N-acetyltransferase
VTAATSGQIAQAMGPDGDLVAARLARGCRCFGAWAGDDLLGYGWLSSGPEWIGEVDLEIRPGDREAYIWNCVTLPPHRRQGVFGAMVAGIAARARTEGLSRLWIGSVAIPAEKVIPRAGFAPVLHFSSELLSGIRWVKVRSDTEVEPDLLAAGREVLAVGGRPLRLDTWMKRAQPRRH